MSSPHPPVGFPLSGRRQRAAVRAPRDGSIDGGLIVQQSPLNKIGDAGDLKIAETSYRGKAYRIAREPNPREMEDLLFGWFVEQGVTSNSVLYIKDGCTVGIRSAD